MKNVKKNSRRGIGLIALVLVSVGGVTLAAFQSPPSTLTGNSIDTASVNVQLSTDGSTYSSTHLGYNFGGIIPGGSPQPVAGAPFWLKSTGTAPVALKMSAANTISNPSNIDLSKVTIWLTTVGSGNTAKAYTLQSLIDASTSGGLDIGVGTIGFGGIQQFKIQVSMAADAVAGNSATLGNIDFAFVGVAQVN